MNTRTRLAGLLGSIAIAAGLVACSSSDAAKPPASSAQPPGTAVATSVPSTAAPATAAPKPSSEMVVDAVDFGYHMSDMGPFAAGMVTVKLTNSGKEPHQVTLARLHDGVTQAQLDAALKTGKDAEIAPLMDYTAGSNMIAPGGEQTTMVELDSGHYVMLCFIPGADGVPHLAKGMAMPFEVVGETVHTKPPVAAGTVDLHDYGITMPANFGHGTFEVKNNGKESHELVLLKLNPGQTMDSLMAWFVGGQQGPPPFAPAGGVAAMAPGWTAYGQFDLAAGNYVALCFLPGPGGAPHLAMGMITPFTVA